MRATLITLFGVPTPSPNLQINLKSGNIKQDDHNGIFFTKPNQRAKKGD